MKIVEDEKAVALKLNQLAREQLKKKLLTDILIDMQICKLEGWDHLAYLCELRELITSLIPLNSGD